MPAASGSSAPTPAARPGSSCRRSPGRPASGSAQCCRPRRASGTRSTCSARRRRPTTPMPCGSCSTRTRSTRSSSSSSPPRSPSASDVHAPSSPGRPRAATRGGSRCCICLVSETAATPLRPRPGRRPGLHVPRVGGARARPRRRPRGLAAPPGRARAVDPTGSIVAGARDVITTPLGGAGEGWLTPREIRDAVPRLRACRSSPSGTPRRPTRRSPPPGRSASRSS